MNLGILVPHGKYFAAEHLCRALSATMYGVSANEITVDHLIIIGMRALKAYSKLKNKNFKSVAVIFSDTNFCKYHKWCNDYVEENNIPVYAMPDLHDYLRVPYIPAYQTITLPKIYIEKPTDRISICHSPGKKAFMNIKGTNQINFIIKKLQKKYPIEYKVLKRHTWEDCIKEKSRSHIFIDQLTKENPYIDQTRFGGKIVYKGALGKSGIEAMMLGCCTVTTMDDPITEPHFPPPPVILTNYFDFEYQIDKLINDGFRSYAEQQKAWVDKYCSPEFVSQHLTGHINETV